jgi:hypothetical protein
MAVFSTGPINNLNPNGTFHSTQVILRVANTTAIPLSPITVHVYNTSGGPPTGTPAILFFTTTFAIGEPNGVVALTISTVVPSYEIRVSSPIGPSDVSIAAQGINAGVFVPDHSFPFGDWGLVTRV